MAPKYLGQIIGIEKDARKEGTGALTRAYHEVQKDGPFTGQSRRYRPRVDPNDGGIQLPAVEERVQLTVEELISGVLGPLGRMYDASATRDYTNATDAARADVRVGDIVLVSHAPLPFILWMEKQVDELTAFVGRFPTHDPSTEWVIEDPRGVYQSTPVETTRQVSQPDAKVIVPPTGPHPAVVERFNVQVVEGFWTVRGKTGSISVDRKATILARLSSIKAALHVAREEANRAEIESVAVGDRVLSFVFDV